MKKTIIKFGDVEIEKKSYQRKKPISIKQYKYYKISFGKKRFETFYWL